ncbi:MAG: Hsp20/alpha crystallin family protein [Kiritimatiellaeota bacterium]|nr:Hsp20/alpha crystallin family protein [Kiritimatiellota bacterium]
MNENAKNESCDEIKTDVAKPKSDRYWKIAVLVMFIMVGAQTVLIYTTLVKKTAPASPITQKERSDAVVLTPRLTSPLAIARQTPTNQSVSTPCRNPAVSSQNLPIPPLPKLNVNINRKGGSPVITPNRQTRSPRFTRIPQSPFNSFPQGVSINIGPGTMGMDMRGEMERMERIMNSFFRMGGISRLHAAIPPPDRFRRTGGSAVSSPTISLENNEYVVKLKIPGIDKSEIKAKVQGNVLTISGTKRMETDNQSKNGRSYISSYSSFQNAFSLPGPVKADKMTMEYKNDTLIIKLPKA